MRQQVLTKYTCALTLTELGLGSLLHAFYVPFSGHFLSLNQGLLLTRLAREPDSCTFTPSQASNVAAVLKSLSPAGKKLTPMLAISAQGFFYSLGLASLGRNIFGMIFGMMMLTLWAFVQPCLLYYTIFGSTLIEAGQQIFKEINRVFHIETQYILWVLCAAIIAKIVLGIGVVFIAGRQTGDLWFERVKHVSPFDFKVHETPTSLTTKIRMGLRGLTQPLFLISFSCVLVFLILNQARFQTWGWFLLRPIAIGFLIHFLIQFIPFEKWLKGSGHGFRGLLSETMKNLKN